MHWRSRLITLPVTSVTSRANAVKDNATNKQLEIAKRLKQAITLKIMAAGRLLRECAGNKIGIWNRENLLSRLGAAKRLLPRAVLR